HCRTDPLQGTGRRGERLGLRGHKRHVISSSITFRLTEPSGLVADNVNSTAGAAPHRCAILSTGKLLFICWPCSLPGSTMVGCVNAAGMASSCRRWPGEHAV